MKNNDEAPNMVLANLVRDARLGLDMTQEALAEAMGKSRHWVSQLERGEWYKGGTFTLDGDNALKLAATLGADPLAMLRAGRVDIADWPKQSQMFSNSDSVRLVDIGSLTPTQQDLIERLVDELQQTTSEKEPEQPTPRPYRRASTRPKNPR